MVIDQHAWLDSEPSNRGLILPPLAFIKKQDDPERVILATYLFEITKN
jgi:hypothetical protein